MKDIRFNRRFWQLDELIDMVHTDHRALISICCDEYYRCVCEVARRIANNKNYKIIMLSGPSGSGKTSTANLLRQALQGLGIHSVVVSLDDFYLGLEKAPLLPNGDFDYESVDALNIPLLQRCITDLINNNRCKLPQFDFLTSKPSEKTIDLVVGADDLIIFEGIHALNPFILDQLPLKYITKIYVSVETTIVGCNGILIPPREIRLARRIVRDYHHRNASAYRTLQMWTGVIHGEEQYLFPYKDDVDYTLNTFHEFEPCVLAPHLLPILHNLPDNCPNLELARDLMDDYLQFPGLSAEELPSTCLIREFIQ